ncbi:MAG: type 1 glutamine amidotransferase, partial [Bryobacteraceae bacterium]
VSEILVLQHAAPETLGTIADSLAKHDLAPHYIRTFDGEPVPEDPGASSGLILMGGPMGVYEQDRHPFLGTEMRLIEQALKSGKPVLGVCLGSQLIAAALGASVRKGMRKEIGWHPVRLTAQAASDPLFGAVPREFTGFHWHGDVFDLPTGADWLASSDLTEFQAFRCDSAWGLLFHLEVQEPLIAGMVDTFAGELAEADVNGAEILNATAANLPGLSAVAATVFDAWAAKAAAN